MIQVVVLTWLQYLGYLSFQTSASDIGSYNQAFYTTVRSGQFFYYTVNIPAGSNGQLFAVHFLPLLVVLAPIYAIAPTPVMLITIKQVALALGAFPLFGLARLKLKSEVWAMSIALAYLVSPMTVTIDWDNFDPEVFLPVAILAGIYFYARGRFVPFLLSWGIALAAIEATAPLLVVFAVASGIGLFFGKGYAPTLTARQEWKFLVAGTVFAVAYFVVSYEFLTRLNPLGGAFGGAYAGHFSLLGASSIPAVFPQAITHPGLANEALHFQEGAKSTYVLMLLGSLGFVPVVGEKRFLAPVLVWLALAFLSNDLGFYHLGTEYPAYVVPFLFPAFVGGVATLRRWLTKAAPVSATAWDPESPAGMEANLARSQRLLRQVGSLRRRGTLPPAANAEVGLTVRALKDRRWRELGAHLDRLEAITASVPVDRKPSRVASFLGLSGPESDLGSLPAVENSASAPSPVARGPGSAGPSRSSRRPTAVRWTHLLGVYLLVCLLVGVALGNPLNPHPIGTVTWFDYGIPTVSSHNVYMQKVIALIPPNGAVLTTSRLFPEVSNRANAFLFPTHGLFAPNRTYQGVIGDYVNRSQFVLLDFQVDAIESVYIEHFVNLSSFGIAGAADGSYLYQRGWSLPPKLWVPSNFAWAGADLSPGGGGSHNGPITQYGRGLYHPADKRVGTDIWSGPHILILPPGTYRATFWWTITAGVAGTQLTVRTTDTPLVFNVSLTNVSSIGHHYNITFSGSPANQTVLDKFAVNSTGPSGTVLRTNGTADFVWTGPGYIDTEGVEVNQKMSMFLYAVLFTQEAP